MEPLEFSCRLCPDRDVCQAPCPWMEAQLPHEPAHHREKTYGLWPSSTVGRAFVPPSNSRLPSLLRRLTTREWQVLRLIYRDGLTQREAARKLSLSRRTVRDCVERARRKLAILHAQNRL